MFEHIMVPYDSSEPAKRALETAMDLAKRYSSKLSVVTHVPLRVDYCEEGATYAETVKLLKQTATYSLSKLETGLLEKGIPCELKVVEGVSTTESLLSYSDLHHVDLIVMGSRGLGGFKKLLLGSTASGVVQHARCGVLIVK
ncbi:MAG TPA: universal stress protein [Candidatus Nitrosotalea sp.]|nr:universal stress protein [Candidatus Nitrosotalea sp.]